MNKDVLCIISEMKNVYHLSPVSDEAIEQAELALGLRFAPEYKRYVKQYGALAGRNFELTGICPYTRINVVDDTRRERQFNNLIPNNMYVVENTGDEGRLILQDECGCIYEIMPETEPRKTYSSLAEYLYYNYINEKTEEAQNK